MLLAPTWDLVYIALGLTIVVYSCIIGRSWTAKIMLATYAAILATDAFGLFFENILMNAQYIDLSRGMASREIFLAFWKLGFFALFLIIFGRKVGYSLELNEPSSYTMRLGSRLLYGIMSAALIATAIMVYTTGASFIFGAFGGAGFLSQVMSSDLYRDTRLVSVIYENARWIFLIPVTVLIFRVK
ncbi:MAG: hypothetical protein NTZ80_02055 [Patescibacteria group bacterium]|nr:hypothetical protein [Patescibacteria group bacterium]